VVYSNAVHYCAGTGMSSLVEPPKGQETPVSLISFTGFDLLKFLTLILITYSDQFIINGQSGSKLFLELKVHNSTDVIRLLLIMAFS